MTEDELSAVEARSLRLWKFDSPSQGVDYSEGEPDEEESKSFEYHAFGVITEYACLAPADLRALLLEVRRMSPVFAAAMDYAGFMNNDNDIHDREDTLVDTCRKAREGQG